ncbi:MAG: tyrosine-type recombinase/integrase [Acidimicrobiales bacterium]
MIMQARRHPSLITQSPKSGKARSVALPRFLSEILGVHVGAYSAGGYVFTSAEGLPLRRSNWYRRHFQPATARADIGERLRFHDLRHTAAALAIARGAHPKPIQERLGHSTIRLTFDRCGHLFPGLDETLRDGLDAAYLGSPAASPRPERGQVVALDAEQPPPGGRLTCSSHWSG